VLSFFLLAFVMTAGALGVILLRQPVHAALSLVGTLLTLAVTYVTLQAHFLAAIQVIVYAGAIMVLFLFVIMLLNAQGDERAERLRWLQPAAYLVGLVAAGGLIASVVAGSRPLPDAATISAALQGGGAGAIGETLFNQFVLAFQLVGVLLLTGIVGAVSLVERRSAGASLDTVLSGGEAQPQQEARPAERERELTHA
jgi:NADH-quinone oxidoreductase subunit J